MLLYAELRKKTFTCCRPRSLTFKIKFWLLPINKNVLAGTSTLKTYPISSTNLILQPTGNYSEKKPGGC